MHGSTQCAICRRDVPPGMGYVVRIDVFADPQLPPMTAGQIATTDFDAELTKLMEQMKDMSADELLEAVHKRLEYRLCPPCQQRYLANPLGMPRGSPVGKN